MKVDLDHVEGLLGVSKRAARAVCTRAGVTLESVVELLEARKVKVAKPVVEPKTKVKPSKKEVKKK
tara:strand:+ start:532 stop:729 length:198 start_codon:yes stop_codon:yes gene_type:complete